MGDSLVFRFVTARPELRERQAGNFGYVISNAPRRGQAMNDFANGCGRNPEFARDIGLAFPCFFQGGLNVRGVHSDGSVSGFLGRFDRAGDGVHSYLGG